VAIQLFPQQHNVGMMPLDAPVSLYDVFLSDIQDSDLQFVGAQLGYAALLAQAFNAAILSHHHFRVAHPLHQPSPRAVAALLSTIVCTSTPSFNSSFLVRYPQSAAA
jgi:hypothetical protein